MSAFSFHKNNFKVSDVLKLVNLFFAQGSKKKAQLCELRRLKALKTREISIDKNNSSLSVILCSKAHLLGLENHNVFSEKMILNAYKRFTIFISCFLISLIFFA